MERKAFSGILLTMISISLLTLLLCLQPVKAQEPIFIVIKPDGSVDPSTAPIMRYGNVYTLTDNIYGEIEIQRSNVVIDGYGYTLQGLGGNGVHLSMIDNVTIKNTNIKNHNNGIYLETCNDVTISGNNITNNSQGINIFGAGSYGDTVSENNITNNSFGIYLTASYGDTFSGNNITSNGQYGIYLYETSVDTFSGNNITSNGQYGIYQIGGTGNTFSGNNITNNGQYGIYLYSTGNIISGNTVTNTNRGIYIEWSSGNIVSGNNIRDNSQGINLLHSSPSTVSGNNITNNGQYGIIISYSDTSVYHNNFIDNSIQMLNDYSSVYNDGYPSGGNYWSDYTGVDIESGSNQDIPGSDGIGDTPYAINDYSNDSYPLMYPFGSPSPPLYTLIIETSIDGTTNPAPGTYSYSQGQNVPVEAIPNPGYYLDHWELDEMNVGNEASYTVWMNAPHTLTAIFKEGTPEIPEFPAGLALEIAFVPILMYIWRKRKQRILE